MSKYVGFRLGKVHESHVISEYYCAGCGWPVTDHDSFCPECGGAFRECDASNLDAGNAKLRETLQRRNEQFEGMTEMWVERGVENAKLRELVRNLLRVIPRDVSGVVIGAHGEHPTYYSFADAMRELGVGE